MKYFVSIEKTPYFYWQTELLIESFKNFGIEKDLLIAIADSKKGGNSIPKNISKCEILLHENWTENFNYKYLNKFLSLDLARRTRRIKPPFTVLEPDMIALKPLNCQLKADVVVSDLDSNNFENFKNFEINFDEKKWTNTGSTLIIFKDAPVMYKDIAEKCSEILHNNESLVQNNWRLVDKIACNLIFNKYHLEVKSKNDLECSLHENQDSYFLHYNNPYEFFSKFKFNSDQEGVLDLSAYYELLTVNPNYSSNINSIQENIKKIIKNLEVKK